MAEQPVDLRKVLDLAAVLANARPKMRTIPATTYTPAPTTEDPNPEPIPVPERTEVYVDPAELPEAVTTTDGRGRPALDLGAQLALLQARVAQMGDARTRVAAGRATVTSGVYLAGATFEVPILFDTPALAVPESGWVQIQPAIAWLGRTKAVVKEGSFTKTGCTITVTALNAISLAAANPITYEIVALYSYTPPVTS